MMIPNITYSSKEQGRQTLDRRIIFIHGKLVGKGIERSALQYAPLINETVTMGKAYIVMPEFDSLLNRIEEEPKNLDLGPISSTVMSAVQIELVNCNRAPIIAYSFGCLLLAKLLRTELVEKIGRIVLIAPVIPKSIYKYWSGVLSNAPTLIIWGTHDNFVKQPKSLTTWFPKAKLSPIEGGNHLYYLMPSPMDRFDENPASISRQTQCRTTAERALSHLKVDKRENRSKILRILAKTSEEKIDLSDDFPQKLKQARNIYALYDHGKVKNI